MQKILTAFIIFFTFSVYASEQEESQIDIIKTDDVHKVDKIIQELLDSRNPKKTLLLLPLDIMFRPLHPALQKPDDDYIPILKRAVRKIRLSKQIYLDELILTEYKNDLTDSFFPKLIDNIQDKSASVIVFSTNVTGGFNKIDFLDVWTFEFLLDKNINLAKGKFGDRQIIFNKRLKKLKGTYPSFYKGLLSCNSETGDNSPQQVITALFALKLKWLPDTVIIMNQDAGFIQSLAGQFKSLRRDIDVIGIKYNVPVRKAGTISPEKYSDFWYGLIGKLNKVKRKGVNLELENPYEQ